MSAVSLTLMKYMGETTSGKIIKTVTMTCHPLGGNHSHISQACSELDNVHGDLEKIGTNREPFATLYSTQ